MKNNKKQFISHLPIYILTVLALAGLILLAVVLPYALSFKNNFLGNLKGTFADYVLCFVYIALAFGASITSVGLIAYHRYYEEETVDALDFISLVLSIVILTATVVILILFLAV